MRIGRYEVEKEIGRGGAGVVYKARSDEGAVVAIKVLRVPTKERLARFEREARLLGSVAARDGFVSLREHGLTGSSPYIVMPFLAGGTLRDRLAQGALPVDEAVAIAARLATALGVAHERGIVHRDVKPENVLFDETGAPLIADLGLAKHFADDAAGASQSVSLSRTGDFQGTAGYMAPEQMSGASDLGPPADVFALGAVLHECLTGSPAFWGETLLDVVTKVAEGSVPDVRRIRPEVPAWLAKLVRRALAPDPARRFADGAELARALEAGASKLGSRSPLRAVLGAGLALAVVAGVAAALTLRAGGGPGGGLHPLHAPAPGVATAPTEAVLCCDRAEAALARREGPAALAAATRAIELEGGLARAWLLRGQARARIRDAERAYADLTKATVLDPRLALAWAERADLRAGVPRTAREAVADATRAIELDGRLARAHQVRGRAHLALRAVDEARADLDRAIELDERCWRAFVYRALVRGLTRDPGASDDAAHAVDLAPDEALAYTYRAAARDNSGDLSGARLDAERAVQLDPDLSVAWEALSLCETKADALDKATVSLRTAVAKDPSNATAQMRLASVLGVTGDPDAAIEGCTRAIEADPWLGDAYHVRAVNRQRKGDTDGALADLDKALEVSPRLAEAYSDRSGLRGRKGEVDGLIADAEKAVALDPRLATAWSNLGRGHMMKGELEATVRETSKALELEPRLFAALLTRGEAYLSLERLEEADADFTKAVAIEPTGSPAFFGRGQVRARRNDVAGARADFEKVISIDPALARQARSELDALARRKP